MLGFVSRREFKELQNTVLELQKQLQELIKNYHSMLKYYQQSCDELHSIQSQIEELLTFKNQIECKILEYINLEK